MIAHIILSFVLANWRRHGPEGLFREFGQMFLQSTCHRLIVGEPLGIHATHSCTVARPWVLLWKLWLEQAAIDVAAGGHLLWAQL